MAEDDVEDGKRIHRVIKSWSHEVRQGFPGTTTMTLSEQITTDMKTAMKAKDNATLSTLRLLRAALKNKEIDVRHELSDEDVLAIIKTQVKQLKDSAESFTQGGREDMATLVQAEAVILEDYLPEQMGDEELKELVEIAVKDSGAKSKVDMGSAMGAAMKVVAGRADGNRVKEIVMSMLPMLLMILAGTLMSTVDVQAAIPMIGQNTSSNFGFIEWGLRIFRVLILWFGIAAITMIMTGGFEYMTASARDDAHVSSISKITNGFLATIVIVTLFSITTVYLNQI